MKDFSGKCAVITGGGTGMGRELAIQLTAEGCNVAICDVSAENMARTRALCLERRAQGARISTFRADVSCEREMIDWAEWARKELETDKIHLLFNNAGIGGGGSFVAGDREQWERTFGVCFYGVLNGIRAFLPLLKAADEAHIVNTSSVNGFWASLGPNRPHTAYSAAKFAVKGFTEALMTDLAVNAPHIHCSIVMPGHIGTEIVANSRKVLSGTDAIDPVAARQLIESMGVNTSALDDGQVLQAVEMQAIAFRDTAPTSAAEAATIILEGVRSGRWRILVGKDAELLDARVRADPERAYSEGFYRAFIAESGWRI